MTEAELLKAAERLTLRLADPSKVVLPQRVVECVKGLRDASRVPAARQLLTWGQARFPNHHGLLGQAAGLAEDEGDLDAAVDFYQRVLEVAPDKKGVHLAGMIRCLTAVGAGDEAIDDAFTAAIVAAPDLARRVDAWLAELQKRGSADIEARLIDLQAACEAPLVGVLLRLPPEARDPLPAMARFLESDEAALCKRAWDDYANLRPLDPADVEALAGTPLEVLRLVFQTQPLDTVPLEEADKAGLDAEAMRWYDAVFLQPDPPLPSDIVFSSQRSREYVEENEARLAFQTRALRERCLRLRDPLTNREQQPFDSVLVRGRTVYSFGADELTFFIAGGGGSKAVCLLLPKRRLIIDLGAQIWSHLTPEKFAILQAEMLQRVARNHAAYSAALPRRSDKPRECSIVAMPLLVENFAHHLWNTFPAIERVIELGLVDSIAELHTVGTEFFGRFDQIFPEFSKVRTVDAARESIRDPYPFSPDHLVLVPGSYFIRNSLIRRIRHHATGLPATDAVAEPPSQPARPYPIVWIGLRIGSRSWVGQDQDIPWLVDALHQRYPDALVLLDGYSYPIGRDLISAQWKSAIQQLDELATTIRDRVSQPDRLLNLVGNTLRESVLWAAATDVYLAPTGTSQHKVGWLSDAPGITYAPHSLAKISPERRPGAYEAEGRPIPETVFGTTAAAGERRTLDDARRNLDNVHLDREEVLARLIGLLEENSQPVSPR